MLVENHWADSVEKHFPKTEEEFKGNLKEMDSEWQFPYGFCAIDGFHLPIKCPPGAGEAMKQYHNFKNLYSVISLALVDANYRFILASLGAPGNTHDSTLFQSSNLLSKIVSGVFYHLPCLVNIEDTSFPPLILGDGAFPIRTWITKPYGDAVLSERKRYYNYRLSSARMVSEGAFGKLKVRWRILSENVNVTKRPLKNGFSLCCVTQYLYRTR